LAAPAAKDAPALQTLRPPRPTSEAPLVNTPPVRKLLARYALLLTLAVLGPCGLAAPAAADESPNPQRQAFEAAQKAAAAALVKGPASVPLKDQATLALPEGYGFIPRTQAAALLTLMGNHVGDNFVGLVVPRDKDKDKDSHWFMAVSYDAAGYVKDDDAKHWDADGLLKSLKENTEAQNAEREKKGIPPIIVTRWIEPPAYEPSTHRLVWSAESKHKAGSDDDPGVNYNTYMLGREGYVSMDLVTSESEVDGDKGAAKQLLEAVNFNGGKRYGDFNSSTDKVAAYGLAALVAGVAAKKLGLLALLAAGAVKFIKVILIAIAAAFAAFRKWFRRSKAPA
jgi:uncharacterized membrane-anchored protein